MTLKQLCSLIRYACFCKNRKKNALSCFYLKKRMHIFFFSSSFELIGLRQLIWKDPDAGKDRRQEEKGETEDEMVGWHQWVNEHEFEQTPGDSEGQRRLACCRPWSGNKLDKTEQLNNNKKALQFFSVLSVLPREGRDFLLRSCNGGNIIL